MQGASTPAMQRAGCVPGERVFLPGKQLRRIRYALSVSFPPVDHSESTKNFVMKNPKRISSTERSARSRSHRRNSLTTTTLLRKLK